MRRDGATPARLSHALDLERVSLHGAKIRGFQANIAI